MRTLWDGAAYREERYAATAMARHRAARPWLDPESCRFPPPDRHRCVVGPVDEIAQNLVGVALRAHRDELTPVLREWALDDDLWVRRTAVICQVGAKQDPDLDLLVRDRGEPRRPHVLAAQGDRLGAARLRRTDPDWVRAEVEQLGDRLSGLSRREASSTCSVGG